MNTHERLPFSSGQPEEGKGREPLAIGLNEAAAQFVAGTLLDGKEPIEEGHKTHMYRCFEANASLPEIPNATFRLDYRKRLEPAQDRSDQVRFEYTAADEKGEQWPVAEMHLGVLDANTFVLEHRYVKPEYRDRRGLGSQLLRVAEGWVQAVADKRGQDTTVEVQAGQEDVMAWLQKNGFSVHERDKQLHDELNTHPDRFVRDQVILSERSLEDGVVKSPYTFRVGTEERHMENAIRLTFEKKFNPTQ